MGRGYDHFKALLADATLRAQLGDDHVTPAHLTVGASARGSQIKREQEEAQLKLQQLRRQHNEDAIANLREFKERQRLESELATLEQDPAFNPTWGRW